MGDLLDEIDFNSFEEEFKIPSKGKQNVTNKGSSKDDKEEALDPPKPKLTSLMEHSRLRNIAICTRKLPPMPIPEMMKAINSLDIQVIN